MPDATTAVAAGPARPPRARTAASSEMRRSPPVRRNLALLVFAALSLAVSMSVGQEDEIAVGSLAYWLLVLPAALLPLANGAALARALLGRARWLLLLLVLGGGWHAAMGDVRAAIQLALLVWVTAWVSSQRSLLTVSDLARLYMAFVLAGIGVDLLTELNVWGLLPGRTADEYGVWRVSFFPNIANTGILSLLMLMLLTRNPDIARRHPLTLVVVAYFLLFSFVRTALIGAALYALLHWWLSRRGAPRGVRLAWICAAIAIGANLLIASSAIGLVFAQDFPLLSRLLLRGETGLSQDEIFQQLYRPWLWGQHLLLFADSPAWMGWGSFDFAALQTDELVEGHPGIGSDALPTRLLAAYGLPGLLFTAYMLTCLRRHADAGDRWACACFPAIFLLMMNWGSVFHPSNALFALFVLMIARGTRGFPDGR